MDASSNLNINHQDPKQFFLNKFNELTNLKSNLKKKYNFFQKISGWYVLHVKPDYKKQKQKIYEESHKALNLVDSLRLVDECSREQLKFLNHIIDCKKNELSLLENIKGCYWKATKINPNDPTKLISHYIIGTIHVGAKYFIQNRKVQEALSNTNQTFTEHFTPLLCTLYKIMSFFSKDPISIFRPMDAQLADKTVQQNKSSQQFETVSDVLKQHSKHYKINPFLLIKRLVKYDLDYEKTKTLTELIYLYATHSWIFGEDKLLNCPEDQAQIHGLHERNLKWIKESRLTDNHGKNIYKGLEEYIDKSQTPACIAVGCAHLSGNDGLLQLFANNGFKLERM